MTATRESRTESPGEATMSLEENGKGLPNRGLALVANGQTAPKIEDEVERKVQEVLGSEIGIPTMLARLKQSITTTKEFAMLVKQRAKLEEAQSIGIKKLCRSTMDNLQRSDHLGGTFYNANVEMMHVHERIAENGTQFATFLLIMNDDLVELVSRAEKSRKGWKENGLAAESKVADLEAATRKSKQKYDMLAEEYERVRIGDISAKRFGFKGPRSAAQQEEDLLRKVRTADQDYHHKVETLQHERAELLKIHRPETIKALQLIIKECDSGLAFQMQQFASVNEKLLLSNGLSISPLKGEPGSQLSLRETIDAIDSEKDLQEYILNHHGRVPPGGGEPKYERNPVLTQGRRSQSISLASPIQNITSHPSASVQSLINSGHNDSVSTPTGGPSANQSFGPRTQREPPSLGRTFSTSSFHGLNNGPAAHEHINAQTMAQQSQPTMHQPINGPVSHMQGPPQLGALPFQSPQSPALQPPPPQPVPPHDHRSMAKNSVPTRPMFGIALGRLYDRDGEAVPIVVSQCIHAIETFGMDQEGIYRLPGSKPQIGSMRQMFNTDPDSPNLDFRNPENFFHDVNSVASLLKQFFRDLPDPLLPRSQQRLLIEAAKIPAPEERRDTLHAIINDLPDPNYATLRMLILHLHRVHNESHRNRMDVKNLAIVWGPTLMGAGSALLSEGGQQIVVIEQILTFTEMIFDDD